jgi:hypothetical protein
MSQRKCEAKDPSTCRVHGTFVFPTNTPDIQTTYIQSEKLKMLLSQEEETALVGYLNNDFMRINAQLNGQGPDMTSEELEQVETINKALKKYQQLNPGEEKITFRATQCYQDFATQSEMESWVAAHYPENGTVTLPGFVSTTASPEALFVVLPNSHADERLLYADHPEELEDLNKFLAKVPDEGLGNLVFVIKNKSGVPVSSLGHHHAAFEQEYLYPAGSQFVVEEVGAYRPFSVTSVSAEDGKTFDHKAHATVITLREK